jgi:hypothetical protein
MSALGIGQIHTSCTDSKIYCRKLPMFYLFIRKWILFFVGREMGSDMKNLQALDIKPSNFFS